MREPGMCRAACMACLFVCYIVLHVGKLALAFYLSPESSMSAEKPGHVLKDAP